MFGGYYSGSAEPISTLFADYEPEGTTHWVEWQTADIITLRSFNLVAGHDDIYQRDINYRGFTDFRLFAWDNTSSNWSEIYTYQTDTDGNGYYDGGPTYTNYNMLELTVNLASPVVAQHFRAEFDQAGGPGNASGPRILELDGYDTYFGATPVPEPASMLLFGSGLAGLFGTRLRRKNR
jgi:hypothetical protein